MKLSSSQLEAFFAVARLRSFTKAAAAIHVTQSALSQRILNLEAEIQTTLFIRDRAGIELTEAAQKLLRFCQIQEKLEDEFLGEFKDGRAGEFAGVIRIAGFSSVMRSVILPCLQPLMIKNPRLKLSAQTREIEDLLPILKRGEADFIVLDHQLSRDELRSAPLGIERSVLVEPRKSTNGAANGFIKNTFLDHDERDQTTISYLKLTGQSTDHVNRQFLGDIYSVIDGVRLGLGRAVIPLHLTQRVKEIRVRNPSVALEVPVTLHYFAQPYYSRLHEVVVQTLQSSAGAILKSASTKGRKENGKRLA